MGTPAEQGGDAPRADSGVVGVGSPLHAEIREALREGTGVGDVPMLRRELGVAEDAGDRELARAIVIAAAVTERASLRRAEMPVIDLPAGTVGIVVGADASFLGRLGALQTRDDGRTGVHAISDVRTLVAVMRAGSLRVRRAAVRRLGELCGEHAKERHADERRLAVEALGANHDVEIVYEVSEALAAMPGAAGREERAARDALEPAIAAARRIAARFWDGESPDDAFGDLSGEERALLLMRVRDLPDVLVDHLCAVIEGADGITSAEARRALVEALRHAGDPRLVPSLGAALAGTDAGLAVEAARALRRIDDPRVLPLLRSAFERTVAETARVTLAGALGEHGDTRGAAYVRELFGAADDAALPGLLEALETLGRPEDVERIAAILGREEVRSVASAIRALGCVGDARALLALEALRGEPRRAALRVDVDSAITAVRARMELRGEEAPRADVSRDAAHAASAAARSAASSDPAVVRIRASWDVLVGRLLLVFGASVRAIARFEAAAARRPGWAVPLLALGTTYARGGEIAQAIGAFRRAIGADREAVERRPVAVRALARCFLTRADELERAGRTDIARGLLTELGALDLRLAESALRFEVGRRHEALRRGVS
jgi:HEAT repeat protein